MKVAHMTIALIIMRKQKRTKGYRLKTHLGYVYFVIVLLSLLQGSLLANEGLKKQLRKELRENHQPASSYSEARSFLFGKLHLESDHQGYFIEDVYCHLNFGSKIGVGNMKIPNANILNTEHTWPQSKFTSFERNAQKTDLHHLFPSQNKANSYRANMIFAEVHGHELDNNCESSKLGTAEGTKIRAFEPPEEHKGNVARALFYFSIRYKASIGKIEESFLRKWNELDPPNEEERKRNELIESFQGNRNPFIDNPKLANKIQDF